MRKEIEIVWHDRVVDKDAADQEEFVELIMIVMNIVCGQTGQGMEMLSILYKGITAINRNILISNEQIMICTEYHKSQAIMDDIKVWLIWYYINKDSEGRTVSFLKSDQVEDDLSTLYRFFRAFTILNISTGF